MQLGSILASKHLQDEVMMLASESEGRFASDGIGVNFEIGLTNALIKLDLNSGLTLSMVKRSLKSVFLKDGKLRNRAIFDFCF